MSSSENILDLDWGEAAGPGWPPRKARLPAPTKPGQRLTGAQAAGRSSVFTTAQRYLRLLPTSSRRATPPPVPQDIAPAPPAAEPLRIASLLDQREGPTIPRLPMRAAPTPAPRVPIERLPARRHSAPAGPPFDAPPSPQAFDVFSAQDEPGDPPGIERPPRLLGFYAVVFAGGLVALLALGVGVYATLSLTGLRIGPSGDTARTAGRTVPIAVVDETSADPHAGASIHPSLRARLAASVGGATPAHASSRHHRAAGGAGGLDRYVRGPGKLAAGVDTDEILGFEREHGPTVAATEAVANEVLASAVRRTRPQAQAQTPVGPAPRQENDDEIADALRSSATPAPRAAPRPRPRRRTRPRRPTLISKVRLVKPAWAP